MTIQPRSVQRMPGRRAALLFVTLIPMAAQGGAWTRNQGDWMFMLPAAYVYADEAFDGNGDRVDRRRFEMYELSPLLEYGFTDDLTGGIQPKYRSVSVETGAGEATNSGVAETDVYLRQRLWKRDQAAFSIQGTVKAPIDPDETDPAALGRDQVDAGISLLFGDRIASGQGTYFYNLEFGYQKRFDEPNDELLANAYAGWSPPGPWAFVVRAANTVGLGNEDSAGEVLTAGPSFRRHEAQLIASYRFSKEVSGVIGASTAYAGENVGVGNTAFASMLFNY